MAQYKSYTNVQIQGPPDYVTGVTACLDVVESIADGKKVLQTLNNCRHVVTIVDTSTGNACGAQTWSAFPPLLIAIKDQNAESFATELKAAMDKAKAGGLTLEHLARQLASGLSPATYQTAMNVVPPRQKTPAKPGASAQDIMFHAGLQTATAMTVLQDLMAGKRAVTALPSDWDYELPRLLRLYLTPGGGAASKVSFNHTKTFHCVDDPAMYMRPPAVGLAHELIHALHNSTGANLALVKKNGANIEEVITTGMPPYNFEELSDNKMRTQWPSHLALRMNY